MRTPLKIVKDDVPRVLRQIQSLAKKEVLIGIPEESASRDGEDVTNAELGFIHEFGSPANNIPARPFLIPGVQKAEKPAAQVLREGALEVIDKNKAVDVALSRAGILAANSVKRQFTDPANDWPPNSEETIERKGSDRPLIDTGELRRSITSVVVPKD